MIVTVERSNGGPTEGAEYILSVYRPGANGGDVDLDVLDGRYVVRTGDTMSGNLVLNNAGLTVERPGGAAVTIKKDGNVNLQLFVDGTIQNENLKIFPDGTVQTEKSSFTNKQLPTKGYIKDNMLNKYLPLTGGIVTGHTAFTTDNDIAIIDIKKGDNTNLLINTDGSIYTAQIEGFVDQNFVTKKYVDDQIDDISIPDTSDFLTKSTSQTIFESGDKLIHSLFKFDRGQGKVPVRFSASGTVLSEIYFSSANTTQLTISEGKEFKIVTQPTGGAQQQVFKTYPDGEVRIEHLKEPSQDHHVTTYQTVRSNPPGLIFTAKSSTYGAENLATGEFLVASNGNIYMYREDIYGNNQAMNTSVTDELSLSGICSIYWADGNSRGLMAYSMKYSSIKFNNNTNRYTRITKSTELKTSTVIENTNYYIAFPGLTC
jgi:hypothetical protein